MDFDDIIIGGGPSGLTLAYCLGKIGRKICLIDGNKSLGGCHRVVRVNGLFVDHGPRVYSTAYLNMINLLDDMGLKFDDIFTPYNFSISTIGGKTIQNLPLYELFWFVLSFLALCWNENWGKNQSVLNFMQSHNFTPQSIDFIDRLCRLTDGAGADRYSLYELLSLVNQQISYKLYQPKKPNDIGLIALWEENLLKLNVSIHKECWVTSISENSVMYNSNMSNHMITGSRIFLAIPPKQLMFILSNSPRIKNNFGDWQELNKWADEHSYIQDIPLTFHWKTELNIPHIWGFPTSEWAIAFVQLSNYMNFQDPRSKTVFSVLITRTESKSEFLGKTANQCTREELIEEAFRQLHNSFPNYNLSKPDFAILHPNVSYQNGRWIDKDTAYVATFWNKTLAPYGKIDNIFNVGTHNGFSSYSFTSFESAVSNAIFLLHQIEPKTRVFNYKRIRSFTSIIRIISFILLIVLVYFLLHQHR